MFGRLVFPQIWFMAAALGTISASAALAAPNRTRVACVGASITYGAGVENREVNCYPAVLQRMLGDRYEVRNFGVSGATMLKHGDLPYCDQEAFGQAKAFAPNVVVIDLGGNDSKPQNWAHKDAFAADARAMVEAFRALPSHPRVLVCLPMPAFAVTFGINDSVIVNEQIPLLRQVAFETGTELIDLHTPFLNKQAWFADNIHPNAEGAALMARVIGEVIGFKVDTRMNVEERLGALGLTPRVTSFFGYRQLAFKLKDGHEVTVVRPYVTDARHPYAWRGEFFGHEPQTDLALLERGYHVVYVNAQDLYGAPPAMRAWEETRATLKKAGLGGKIVLIGMSRGGLYCYHWAALHPDTVAVLYADAPVCDFKSWPGAGRATASRNEWAGLLRAYGFKTDEEALAYRLNPVDNLAPLAKAHIPILHVVGQADDLVPVADNTDIVERRYRALGGTIEVIRKPGVGHHPHSLPDPQPIVDFVTSHWQ